MTRKRGDLHPVFSRAVRSVEILLRDKQAFVAAFGAGKDLAVQTKDGICSIDSLQFELAAAAIA